MNEMSSIPVHPIPSILRTAIEPNADERCRVYFHPATRGDHIKACQLRLAKFSEVMPAIYRKQLERKLRRLLNRNVRKL